MSLSPNLIPKVCQLSEQQCIQLKTQEDSLSYLNKANITYLPALRGRGTPPTNTVLRGSSGMEASSTKSASDSRQGRICTGLSFIVGEDTHR